MSRYTPSMVFVLLTFATVTHGTEALGKPICGDTPGDRAAIATVQATAATACPCDTAVSNKDYAKCVRGVVEAAVTSGTLPAQCKNTVVQAASHSVCGKPAGTVTCCKVSATGKKSCTVVSSADKCKAPKGGTATIGASESCYDACLPSCEEVTRTDTEVQAAVNIALEGIADPWGSGFGSVIARATTELSCRIPTPSSPSGLQAQTEVEEDCLHNQCEGVFYCGPTNTHTQPLGGAAPAGPCLNRACFEHDLCSFEDCVNFDPPCYFSPQSATCDIPFFTACQTCPLVDGLFGASVLDLVICGVAGALELTPRPDPDLCQNPKCSVANNQVCDPSTSDCIPNCDDGIPCTRDVFVAGSGCSHTPDDFACNSGATGSRVDPDEDCDWAVCFPTISGADANGCVLGREFEDRGAPCKDSVECTRADFCAGGAGACHGGGADDSLCPNQDDSDDDCFRGFCGTLGCVLGGEEQCSPCAEGDPAEGRRFCIQQAVCSPRCFLGACYC
jgi:hypothetical protein